MTFNIIETDEEVTLSVHIGEDSHGFHIRKAEGDIASHTIVAALRTLADRIEKI